MCDDIFANVKESRKSASCSRLRLSVISWEVASPRSTPLRRPFCTNGRSLTSYVGYRDASVVGQEAWQVMFELYSSLVSSSARLPGTLHQRASSPVHVRAVCWRWMPGGMRTGKGTPPSPDPDSDPDPDPDRAHAVC